MKNVFFVVAIGVTSTIFSGVPFLPSASAECILTADPCSTDAGSEECCFAELGAVCDTSSNGGSCCFPNIGDEEAVCTQDDDCCGGLLCIADVCSDRIEFTVEDVHYTHVIAETAYGSGAFAVSEVTAQQEGSEAVVFTLDASGEVTAISSNGETLYSLPTTSVRHLQTNQEGGVATVDSTHLKGSERSTRNLAVGKVDVCVLAALVACNIAGSAACSALTGGLGAFLCGILARQACDKAAPIMRDACENMLVCKGNPQMWGLQGQPDVELSYYC